MWVILDYLGLMKLPEDVLVLYLDLFNFVGFRIRTLAFYNSLTKMVTNGRTGASTKPLLI